MTKGLNVHGYTMLQVTHDPAIAAKAKKYVFDRLAEGRFVPKIARTFPFTQTIEAYQYWNRISRWAKWSLQSRKAAVSVWLYAMACGLAALLGFELLPTSAAAAASTRWWMVNSRQFEPSLTPGFVVDGAQVVFDDLLGVLRRMAISRSCTPAR